MAERRIEVLVVGSGVMGRGIAAAFARGGIATAVLSRNPDGAARQDSAVQVVGALPDAPPALIVESIPEKMELKLELFARVEAAYGGAPVLGSNTSSLPLQDIADRLRHPRRFCGVHYFQPADVTPLVEVARVRQTEDAAVARAVGLLERSAKAAIVLGQPVPGLLINRLQHAILHEAYHLIDAGIVTAADVDRAAKELLGPRMSVTGLIEQKDLSGLDTHALAQRELVPVLHHGAEPGRIVQEKYAAGDLGVKTGAGFYDWRGMDVPVYQAATGELLAQVLDLLRAARPSPPPLADNGSDG